MTILTRILENQTREERFAKAARHLRDALFLRRMRNDFDIHKKNAVRMIYELQTNPLWEAFLSYLGWGYMLLSILEPSYSNDQHFLTESDDFRAPYYQLKLGLEGVIIGFFWIDLIFAVIHRWYDHSMTKTRSLLANKKMIFKYITCFAYPIDLIHFNSVYPARVTIQFSRYLRPGTCFSIANELIVA